MAPGVGSAIAGVAVFIFALYFYGAIAPTMDDWITNFFTTDWAQDGARIVQYTFFFCMVVMLPIMTVLGLEGNVM